MKRACVIGWPIEHSRSPSIHDYWLRRYGIDGAYTREAVRPEAAAQFMRSLALRGLAGCNVTVPHKEVAFAVADERDAAAVAIGAANTVWLDEGRICCANTDAYGFMTHLDRSAPEWRAADAPVAILGAGGAARAIVHGFLEAGVGEVRVFNRSAERADELARHFRPKVMGSRIVALPWAERSTRSAGASVLVNTTTLGMKGAGDPGVDFAGFDDRTVVYDIVYVPLETSFLSAARRQGLRTVDGLGMLLHQAVPGFARWFGVRPEVTDELRALIVADIEGGS